MDDTLELLDRLSAIYANLTGRPYAEASADGVEALNTLESIINKEVNALNTQYLAAIEANNPEQETE